MSRAGIASSGNSTGCGGEQSGILNPIFSLSLTAGDLDLLIMSPKLRLALVSDAESPIISPLSCELPGVESRLLLLLSVLFELRCGPRKRISEWCSSEKGGRISSRSQDQWGRGSMKCRDGQHAPRKLVSPRGGGTLATLRSAMKLKMLFCHDVADKL